MSYELSLDSFIDDTKPYMFIEMTSDIDGSLYRVLTQATYEQFPDGKSIVYDPYIRGIERDHSLSIDDLPEDVADHIALLFESADYLDDMLKWHEQESNPLPPFRVEE